MPENLPILIVLVAFFLAIISFVLGYYSANYIEWKEGFSEGYQKGVIESPALHEDNE